MELVIGKPDPKTTNLWLEERDSSVVLMVSSGPKSASVLRITQSGRIEVHTRNIEWSGLTFVVLNEP